MDFIIAIHSARAVKLQSGITTDKLNVVKLGNKVTKQSITLTLAALKIILLFKV